MSVWFVTGASRGFGAEIVEKVLAAGHSVVATARDPQAIAARFPDAVTDRKLHRHSSLVIRSPMNESSRGSSDVNRSTSSPPSHRNSATVTRPPFREMSAQTAPESCQR
jgi:NAD(P)-dependent dehydrogenase (short-subunit alcohol dehydrogenase family)